MQVQSVSPQSVSCALDIMLWKEADHTVSQWVSEALWNSLVKRNKACIREGLYSVCDASSRIIVFQATMEESTTDKWRLLFYSFSWDFFWSPRFNNYVTQDSEVSLLLIMHISPYKLPSVCRDLSLENVHIRVSWARHWKQTLPHKLPGTQSVQYPTEKSRSLLGEFEWVRWFINP